MRSVYQVHNQKNIQPMNDRITEPALGNDELKSNLWEAMDKLGQYRGWDSIQIVSNLLRRPLPEETRVLLHEAKDMLYTYQDDKAHEMLRTAFDTVAE
jgi:hypothetical protein